MRPLSLAPHSAAARTPGSGGSRLPDAVHGLACRGWSAVLWHSAANEDSNFKAQCTPSSIFSFIRASAPLPLTTTMRRANTLPSRMKAPKEPKDKKKDKEEKEDTAASGTAALKDLTGDPFLGHLGHLTSQQEVVLTDFKTLLAGEGLYKAAEGETQASHDDPTLLYVLSMLKRPWQGLLTSRIVGASCVRAASTSRTRKSSLRIRRSGDRPTS